MGGMWNEAKKDDVVFQGLADGVVCNVGVVTIKNEHYWLRQMSNSRDKHCAKPLLEVEVVHPSRWANGIASPFRASSYPLFVNVLAFVDNERRKELSGC